MFVFEYIYIYLHDLLKLSNFLQIYILDSTFLKSRSFFRILDPEIPTFYGRCNGVE